MGNRYIRWVKWWNSIQISFHWCPIPNPNQVWNSSILPHHQKQKFPANGGVVQLYSSSDILNRFSDIRNSHQPEQYAVQQEFWFIRTVFKSLPLLGAFSRSFLQLYLEPCASSKSLPTMVRDLRCPQMVKPLLGGFPSQNRRQASGCQIVVIQPISTR